MCAFAQSCPTLCDPMTCSLPDSSVRETLQSTIQESVAISFSRGPSQPRIELLSPAGGFFTIEPLGYHLAEKIALSEVSATLGVVAGGDFTVEKDR